MNKKVILDFNFWMNNIKMNNRQIKDKRKLNAFFIPPGLSLTAKTRCGNESSKIKEQK